MQWQEIQVITDRDALEAVADIFHQVGAGGVIIEDPQLKMQYIEEKRWDYYEFPEVKVDPAQADKVTVKAYLAEGNNLQEKIEDLKHAIKNLKLYGLPNCFVELSFSTVEDEDWATSWKAYYKPEKVGFRVVIKPTWEEYTPKSGDLVVELDPGMAFGTGTHPTTVMCILALEENIQGGEKVFDVGTGSGVLAIVAAMLGAADITAVDLDETAVRVAAENVEYNDVSDRIRVREGNLLDVVEGKANVVVANIIADIIIMACPDVYVALEPEGLFIASGIIEERFEEVKTALEVAGFKIATSTHQEGWVAVQARKGGA
ncbi:MAG: 50S ribosomal protein L11 methyltransferase [Carboxydocellales bacterium]